MINIANKRKAGTFWIYYLSKVESGKSPLRGWKYVKKWYKTFTKLLENLAVKEIQKLLNYLPIQFLESVYHIYQKNELSLEAFFVYMKRDLSLCKSYSWHIGRQKISLRIINFADLNLISNSKEFRSEEVTYQVSLAVNMTTLEENIFISTILIFNQGTR